MSARKVRLVVDQIRGKTVKALKFVGAQNWDDPRIRQTLRGVIQKVADGAEMEEILEVAKGLPQT